MKRLLILFGILAALGLAAFFIKGFVGDDGLASMKAERDFAYPKEEIGKIIIQKKGDETQIFKRKGNSNQWTINDTYNVSEFAMPYLLQTISAVQIQNIPSNAAKNNILAELKRVGVHVTIFDKSGNQVKSYQVGTEAPDRKGTTFLMDGSDQPFNLHLRGFDGDLRTRFLQTTEKWRGKKIFGYESDDISSVIIDYHKNNKASFHLVRKGDIYEVEPLTQFITKSGKSTIQERVKGYLGGFSSVFAEGFDNGNLRKDSIRALIPFATISITNTKGKTKKAALYPFKDLLTYNSNSKDLEDAKKIERYFVDTGDDFLVMQNRLIIQALRSYQFFVGEED